MTRPLERVYPVVFIDAMVVKIRDGQVANRPIYTAIGVTVDGKRDVLGLWAGTGGEGAKFWLQVLTEIKNRGVDDVCIVCCDGLKGLPDSIAVTWPLAVVQTCVLHLIRNTFRLASRADWEKMAKDLRPVYTAVNEADAAERLADFDSERSWRTLDAVNAVAREKETTAAAVSLAWLLAKPTVSSVIFGARSVEQLDDNLKGAEVKLTAEDVKRLKLRVGTTRLPSRAFGGVELDKVDASWLRSPRHFVIEIPAQRVLVIYYLIGPRGGPVLRHLRRGCEQRGR